jgi:SpoIID/LytB domain protein
MEKFSTCWEDRDMPYLQPLADAPGHGDGKCFCDTQDKEILGQVLNNYDQETVDFFRWKVEYGRDSLSELVAGRSGMELGRIQSLEPLERGESGRIYKLKIVGSEKTLTVGKELEIRRLLSESHLKSSAFDVEYLSCGQIVDAEADWDTLILHGKGWGHGVGLCQIGAAVMASQGYTYKEILSHYYPETELK